MEQDKLKSRYLQQAELFFHREKREERILLILSAARLFVFLGGLAGVWLGFRLSTVSGILLIPVFAGLFMFMLKLYSDHSERKGFFSGLVIINRNEAAAVTGDIHAFESGISYIDPHHEFSPDLDLYGRKSLFQYLNRTVTGYGSDILAGWLGDPFSLVTDLGKRQEAIKELAGKEGWRQKFMASGMKIPLEGQDIAGLIRWMDEKPFFKTSSLRRLLIYILPFLAVISFILVLTAGLHFSVFALIFLLNIIIVTAGLRRSNRIHRMVTGMHNYLSSLHILIEVFEDEDFSSSLLNEVKSNLSGKDFSASVAVKRLSRLIQSFDARLNIMAGFILNGLLLWDYHCIYRLERWNSEYRFRFPEWLEMAGNIDALISLGNYACNNQSYAYPRISDGDVFLAFEGGGHPLIDGKKRVCNDFELKREGNICVISGANMSGKSTFLRTVAINMVLAMTGAPVCARQMVFTPCRLFTGMRTTDSLSENASYFYAELKRLKALLSTVESGGRVLFILDEILKGTNSADKSLGSKIFLKRLIDIGGTGLIATHDISLGGMEDEYPGVVFNMCFEIDIDGEDVNFDYKLRRGITQKMNAVLLMKQMGILD